MKRNQIFVNSFSDINLDNIGDKDEYVIDVTGKKEEMKQESAEYIFYPLENLFHEKYLLIKSYTKPISYYINRNRSWIMKYFFKNKTEDKAGFYLYSGITDWNSYYHADILLDNIKNAIYYFKNWNIKVSFDGEKFKLIKTRKLNTEKIELKIDEQFKDPKEYRWRACHNTDILDVKVYLYSRTSIETGNIALKVYLYYYTGIYIYGSSPLKYNVFNYINGGLVPAKHSSHSIAVDLLRDSRNYQEALQYIEKVIKMNISPEDNGS